MTTITCIAVDDEPKALEVVKSHLAKMPFLRLIATFTDALSAINYLQQETVDVVFLDIQMPDLQGTQLARMLKGKTQIIFTTAYSDYAVEGFELKALDYLVKPISFPRFFMAGQRAFEYFNANSRSLAYTFVKDGFDWVRIEIDDILYIKSEGNYLEFFLKDRKVLSRMTMKDVLELLPSPAFEQVHRSYVVSKQHVERISRDEIRIKDHVIPIGNSYMHRVESWIAGHSPD